MKGIVNHRRCIDLLQSLPEVDPERIGVIGHSLGGHNAMFVAAFDERLKAIVSSCGWTPFHDYYGGKVAGWTSDRYMPRIKDMYELDADRIPFDFYEVVAALAPRPFLSCSPVEDGNFDIAGVRRAIPRAQEVYRLLGAETALQLLTPPCGHDFPTETRETAYKFLDAALEHRPARTLDFSAELPRVPPLEPPQALSSIETLPGFEAQLVAAEPLVVDPVAVAFDERSRLYVVEMIDYSEQETERLGRVRLLTDDDGDGRYERSVVFADGFSWPTAVACYDGGVFVGAAPDVYYLKDSDHDGRADVRTTVFTGFGRGNVQGLFNSFRWGWDGRIYGAASSSGGDVVRPGAPNDPPVTLRGRDFSFDPRTLALRSESGGAQHGMSFDEWGRRFVCSNSDHCQAVLYDDRYFARNPQLPVPGPRQSIADDGGQAPVFRISPVEPWRIVRTRLRVSGETPGVVEGGGRAAGYFTGATGITIYTGDAYPDEYRGLAFIGDVGSNIVHRKRITPQGVGFTATRLDTETEFLRSKDIWFRPAQFANAPDGCLQILDVYREVIEHPKSLPPQIKQHLDLTSGRDRGRLYRVVPQGVELRGPVDLSRLENVELVRRLEHPNGWHRETAHRLLVERGMAGGAGIVDGIADAARKLCESSASPLGRLNALWILGALDRIAAADAVRAMRDPHPRVREYGARFAERHAASAEAQAAFAALVGDADDRVRLQAAFSVGEFPEPFRQSQLLEMLRRDGADQWLRLAALSSAADGAAALLRGLVLDAEFRASPIAANVLPPLAQLIGRQQRPAELAIVLETIQRPEVNASGWTERIVLQLAVGLPSLRARLRDSPLGGTLEGIISAARSAAGTESTDPERRADAARTLRLGDFATDGPVLTGCLDPRVPAVVQSAAIEALGQFPEPAAAEAIVAQWSRLSPTVRREAEEAVCARPPGVSALLRAIEAEAIAPADISPARVQLLLAHRDAALRDRAAKLFSPASSAARQQVVERYQPALRQRGDIERGRAVFRKQCSACHKLEGFGQELGPNLATMRNRGPEAIVLNVLDPNREVNPQYQSYIAVTEDGLTHTGMIQSETASAITLARGDGKTETLLRADVAELKSTGLSLMPEGLEKEIDIAAFADLLAYLEQAR